MTESAEEDVTPEGRFVRIWLMFTLIGPPVGWAIVLLAVPLALLGSLYAMIFLGEKSPIYVSEIPGIIRGFGVIALVGVLASYVFGIIPATIVGFAAAILDAFKIKSSPLYLIAALMVAGSLDWQFGMYEMVTGIPVIRHPPGADRIHIWVLSILATCVCCWLKRRWFDRRA